MQARQRLPDRVADDLTGAAAALSTGRDVGLADLSRPVEHDQAVLGGRHDGHECGPGGRLVPPGPCDCPGTRRQQAQPDDGDGCDVHHRDRNDEETQWRAPVGPWGGGGDGRITDSAEETRSYRNEFIWRAVGVRIKSLHKILALAPDGCVWPFWITARVFAASRYAKNFGSRNEFAVQAALDSTRNDFV